MRARRIKFADITDGGKPGPFNAAFATEILDFVEAAWDKVEVFLIHCEVGLSRSPAIATALSRIHYGDNEGRFESDFPNPFGYRLLVETHARRSGRLS